jgi:hypothetical protein
MHPLLDIMNAAAQGIFPAADGVVEVMPLLPGSPHIYILELTGHAYVMTSHTQAELVAVGADGFGGVVHPNVLNFLAGVHRQTTKERSDQQREMGQQQIPKGAQIGCHDALLVAKGTGAPGHREEGSLPHRLDLDEHPRVGYAKIRRRHVKVYGDDRGLVTLGKGIADRWEISVEVDPKNRSAGNARALITAALSHVPSDEWCFGEVSPGNAASLRSFLAAGWIPIGAEIIIMPEE